MSAIKTTKGIDGVRRCSWCGSDDDYIKYHDNEWGMPVDDDIRLFEKLCLESFQSGLSWRTILSKRDNLRQAFCDFDYSLIAQFSEKDVKRCLADPGIIRHRGKIEAVINNAQRAEELILEFGSIGAFIWQFEPSKTDKLLAKPIASSAQSTELAKALKKRGWKFVGPTTAYAFMQAMGLVNDHAKTCELRAKVKSARLKFNRPLIT